MRRAWLVASLLCGCLTKPSSPPAAGACTTNDTLIDPFVSGACGSGTENGTGSAGTSGGTLTLSVPNYQNVSCTWPGQIVGSGVSVDVSTVDNASAHLDVTQSSLEIELVLGTVSGTWQVRLVVGSTTMSANLVAKPTAIGLFPFGTDVAVYTRDTSSWSLVTMADAQGTSFEQPVDVDLAAVGTASGAASVDFGMLTGCATR
ncbi:MAG TPA: hypothetical protein VMJ10_12875 [Kofleriaceae bacterium]|nr:hypothetical protein [Kofleriaceae bacterium]